MAKHGLEVENFPGVCTGDESPETGDEMFPWVCRVKAPHAIDYWANSEIGGGATCDEACADLAKNRGIKLWNEEGAQ